MIVLYFMLMSVNYFFWITDGRWISFVGFIYMTWCYFRVPPKGKTHD